jgi:hypothetical protein
MSVYHRGFEQEADAVAGRHCQGLSKSDQFDFLIDIVPREEGAGSKREGDDK